MAVDPTQALWRTSSYSGTGKECVEVADVESGAYVRDSKQPGLGHLAFATEHFPCAFTDLLVIGAGLVSRLLAMARRRPVRRRWLRWTTSAEDYCPDRGREERR